MFNKNMRNFILYSVLNGFWTYQDAGILDRTYLRFFTLVEINTMFKASGNDGLD